jgi:hypothetical protein
MSDEPPSKAEEESLLTRKKLEPKPIKTRGAHVPVLTPLWKFLRGKK